ncbi:unnamed protein product, partial [Ectocarpus fasciculatus]
PDDDDDESPPVAEGRQIYIILDGAQLETVKTKKGDFQLLNCDDHINIMKRNGKDPQKYRPDIIHQELMAVLDSPLNKAGKVKIFMHTSKNVLVEVNPKTRIPRTFKRFSGLMVQLLHRLKIRSADGNEMLLKVVKNPMSRHLPAGIRCYGLSHQGTLTTPMKFAESIPSDAPIAFVFGAFAVGKVDPNDHPYMQDFLSISEYPLSGVVAINRVLGAIEDKWGIC